MATMEDVARAAGVSRSTVSYVLSGTRPISDQTRQQVLQAMKHLDYTPNALAQGLAGKRTGIIALIVPVTEVGFNLTDFEYIQAATDQARREGYHLLLWPYSAQDVEELRKVVSQGIVEGVVLMEVRTVDERVSFLLEEDLPFTTIGRTGGIQPQSFVDADFEATVNMAVEYALGLGHENLAYITRSRDELDAGHGPMVRMRDAVLAAAGSRGLRIPVFTVCPTFNGGWDAFDKIRAQEPRVTALLTFNEPAVPGFTAAAAEHGVRIPRDLSLVGLNGSEDGSRTSHPNVTGFSPNHSELARLAVNYLVRRLRGEDPAAFQKLFTPELTVRASCAAAPSRPGPSRNS
ncbi:LacI family transcriptional regulator [Arthrobacter sp. GN70]|uniref:LacI family transcriptional regulator n=2 Tax=Arthrobacter TaxID=1663 RepID=A0A4R5JXU1_9MICC|nr:LacI family transcriptional regulator [Arthrobacter sp. GN70]TDF83072.1 LacI family transcriptional regulator [Arthrobacter terricola]